MLEIKLALELQADDVFTCRHWCEACWAWWQHVEPVCEADEDGDAACPEHADGRWQDGVR